MGGLGRDCCWQWMPFTGILTSGLDEICWVSCNQVWYLTCWKVETNEGLFNGCLSFFCQPVRFNSEWQADRQVSPFCPGMMLLGGSGRRRPMWCAAVQFNSAIWRAPWSRNHLHTLRCLKGWTFSCARDHCGMSWLRYAYIYIHICILRSNMASAFVVSESHQDGEEWWSGSTMINHLSF